MKKLVLTLLTVICAVSSSWGYKATINFYDADKLSSTSGTNLTGENYANFVTVPAGQTKTDVITGVTCDGTVRFGMNGGLTVGTGSANGNNVTFDLGTNVVVTKCTVWATKYDGGKWKLNGNNADSGEAAAKGSAIESVTNPYVWGNLSATTLKFTKCTDDSKEGNCKRMTILRIEIEYTVDGDPGTTISVTGVTLSPNSATITIGKNIILSATITPADASNKDITWKSDNTSVATVDNGVITAVAEGNATITVKTADGNFTAECIVTVVPKTAPVGSVFYESFDKLNGKGGNDGVWSNISTSYAWDAEDCDNEGWTTEGTMNQGYQCASIRKCNSTTPSGLTTPEIGVAGNGSVTFNAEAWGGDTSEFYVQIIGGGTFDSDQAAIVSLTNNGTQAKVALQKKGEFKEYNLTFTGLTASSKFKFYMAAEKRGFLDEVAVFITEIPVTVNQCGNASFSCDKALDFTNVDGVKAYMVTAETAESVTLTEIKKVPANTGIFVVGEDDTYNVPVLVGTADNASENMLEATTTAKTVAADENIWALSKTDGKLHPVSVGVTIGAGKAYLKSEYPASQSLARSIIIDDDITTGIQSVQRTANDSQAYNLAGQRVAANAKGIVIINGKKYIVK